MATLSIVTESAGAYTGNEKVKVTVSGLSAALSTYNYFYLTTSSAPSANTSTATDITNNYIKRWDKGTDWSSSSNATSITLETDSPVAITSNHIKPATANGTTTNQMTVRVFADNGNATKWYIGSATIYRNYAWLGLSECETLLDLPASSYNASWTLNTNMNTACNNACNHTVENSLDTNTTNIYKSGGGYVDFSFDFSGANRTGLVVPNDTSLYEVEVLVKGKRESATIDSTHIAKFDLYSNGTLKTEGKEFTTTSSHTITIYAGVWTGAEINAATLRFTVAAYGGAIFGITWRIKNITYANSSNSVTIRGITRAGTNNASWYPKVGVYATTSAGPTRTSTTYNSDFTVNQPITISSLSASSNYTLFLQDKTTTSTWYRVHTSYIPGDQTVSTTDTRIFKFRLCTPITVTSAGTNIQWDGNPHNLVTTTNGTSRTTYYRIGTTGTWSTTVPQGTDPGTYNIYWYSNKASAYCLGLNQGNATNPMGPVTAVIKSATPTYTAPTSKTNLTYNNSPQILINEGTCTNGVLWYKIGTSGTWTDDVDHYIRETNAGTYTIYYYVKGNTGYSDIGSQSNPIGYVTTTIQKVNPVLTAPTGKTGLIYTGSAQQLINAGSSSHGTFYYKLSTSSSFSTDATNITGTNTGTYTIQWYLLGDNNHNDYGRESGPGGYEYEEFTVTISNKPTATWSTQPTIKTNLTYTGSAQQLINAGASSEGTPYYRVGTSGTWQTSVTVTAMKGTNAGTYTVQCYIAGDSTHTDSSILTLSPVIDKADITTSDFTAPTGVSVYYDDNYHQLVNAGSVSSTIGTMYYKADGPGQTWVTDAAVITASEEGEYWIYWKITGSDNYNDYTPSPEYVVSTISAMPTPTYTAPTGRITTWTTGNINLVTAGSVTNGSFYYKVGTGSWGQANTIPTTTTVGSYTIYWYIKGNTGYADIGSTSNPAGSVTSYIYIPPTSKTNLTYTGSTQTLFNNGTAPSSSYTVQYRLASASSTTNWTTTVPSQTNAATYEYHWRIATNTTYSTTALVGGATDTYKLSVTIDKATPTYTAPTGKSLSYTGSNQQLINNAGTVPTECTMNYRLGTTGTWTTTASSIQASAVDTYTIYYYITGNSNYTDRGSTSNPLGNFTASIGQSVPTYTAPTSKTSLTYTGSSQQLINAGSATNGTLYYKLNNGTWGTTANSITGTNAGDYTIYYYVKGNTGYSDIGSESNPAGNIITNIAKADPTYTAPSGVTAYYNGNNITLISGGSVTPNTCTFQYKVNSGSWSATATASSISIDYKVYYYVKGDTNYNDIGSTSNPIGYVSSQILSSVAVYNGTQWVRSSVTGYYESNSIYSKCLIYYYDGSAWQLCGYQEN